MKRAIKILFPILLALAIILCLAWYLLIYDREFTRDVLLSSARYFEGEGNHSVAAWFYNRAYAQAGNNDDVAIELAQQHKKTGNYTRAEYTLSKAIEDGGGVDLYIELSKTYVEQDKVLDAVKLLDGVLNADIQKQLLELRPAAPIAVPEPGFYSQYISIALQSDDGTVYANSALQYPSIQEAPYSEPIPLTEGENTIYAVSIADNGLVSPLSIFGYTIVGVVEEVSFADPAIEAEIRNQLSLAEDSVIYTNDLWDILSFTVPEGTTTLSDLTYLPFLESLTISNGPSQELKVLSPLANLVSLTVADTTVASEELDYIGNLPKLEKLTLSNCSLSTTTGLENAINLKYLDLSNNTIRNIDALLSMPNLQQINLQQNALTDLSALTDLENLQELNVSFNSLTALTPLSGCAKLTWLNARNNALTDLAHMDKLTELTYLDVSYNSIADISSLSACTKLAHLNISNNSLTDIASLSALIDLSSLYFSYNQVEALPEFQKDSKLIEIDGSHNLITTLEPLRDLDMLNNVYMDYNPELDSVEPLANCHVLILVNVYGTKVTEVEILTDQSIIVNYDPTQVEES